ncbi:MAG: NgoFVII family restriction endonuclease [Clostridiales bacterium 36_14]|nr:MAG: NgoFVII family restriction endonuclease [Clostridiales bacterium 36_14]
MTNNKIIQFQSGFNTAFINSNTNSNLAYRPQFIYNNNKDGQKVFSAIEDELCKCDSFTISVAFITRGGITPLLQTLKELERRGIPGRILTTDYLTFSDPVALDTLAGLSNVELRMYQTERAGNGFHTKGYIFQNKEEYRFIIGSSNLTQDALTRNMEWNTKLVSTDKGEMLVSILDEFDKLWNSVEFTKTYDEFIQDYRRKYKEKQLFDKMVAEQKKIAKNQEIPSIESYTLQPNSMQRAFIYNLLELRNKSVDKALLISATGTGKTYASAFAMRELGFQRVLFLVHRNQIAKQAKTSFETVFGNNIRTGLVSGTDHDYNADFVFATVQTLSRQEHLDKFSRNYFDACIYDEAHHTSAGSYKKVMDYFTPKFTLGMTATPDKRDDNIEGRNIYEVFDYNIAYEIRLQQAMDEDLLCPFHYFGITDLAMVSDQGKSKEEQLEHFRYLTSDERVKYVMKQSEYYGYSGDRVKGLIFCSRIEEARELSVKFNERGWKTIALSGADPEKTRLEAIDRLTMDVQSGNEDYLDYIITVDIFSEGTDIVEVNQVIMLRPTQSPIVFIQQLGRGLRKAPQKEYVVILDFIGNYKNNFMIPIALSGDRSYNKDNIRRYLLEGGRVIPGASTIHFDEISRKRIFAAVDGANFSDIKLIKENYTNLKNKLGRIPKLKDFDDYGEMDVLRIFDNNSLGSYYKFLEKYEKDYTERLSPEEEKVIEFVSKKLANGKRIQELKLLDRMLGYAHEFSLFSGLQKELNKNYGLQISQEQKDNIVNIMTNQFPAGASKKTYSDCILLEKDDQKGTDYHVSKSFEVMLANKEFYGILKELIDFGISRYERDFSHTYRETDFVLYQKYTYEDVCRLLNWETNEVPLNIGGYKFDKKTKTFPVFINYDKSEDISDTTKYEDHFISSNRLIAISKSGRSIQSEDVQNFLHAEERGIQVHLFVRKNKDDKISKEFYYLGYMHASENVKEFVMPNTSKTAVEIEWLLDVPVREDLYEYIINE